MSRRYVIVGAGAVGAALAAGLSDAGIPVKLVSRGTTYQAIRANGLVLTHAGVTRTLDVDVVAGPLDVALRSSDVLVLAVKTQDAHNALALWAAAPAIRPDGTWGTAGEVVPVLTLQNGLDTERAALRHFATVISGTTLVAASHTVPGEVRVFNAPKLGQVILGAHGPSRADADAVALSREIAADLTAASWLAQAVEDPTRWKAWKLLNSATFAVGVLDGSAEDKEALTTRLRDEARAVLGAAGHDFANPDAELAYDRNEAGIAPDSGWVPGQLSTWQSFERGSGSEVDYLNGEVVLQSRLTGVPAPANLALQLVLARSAAAGERPGARTVAEVVSLAEARAEQALAGAAR